MEAIFEIPYSLARETSEEIEIYFAGMVRMGGWGVGWGGGGKGTISQNDECGGSRARPCL